MANTVVSGRALHFPSSREGAPTEEHELPAPTSDARSREDRGHAEAAARKPTDPVILARVLARLAVAGELGCSFDEVRTASETTTPVLQLALKQALEAQRIRRTGSRTYLRYLLNSSVG